MTLSENLLRDESSPYLLQHADNPVHWRPWGAAALAEAKACDKPILLSIGYAACHWCHVMAHESFENRETAALMNLLFVNVKIDREERPDIDHIYMSALHAMGQQGGWPLTMFVTPDGAPFWGGTYFPPEPRWGRASFAQILEGIARAWRDRRADLLANSAALDAHLAALSAAAPGVALTPDDLGHCADLLLQQCDRMNGGMGDAPKFPNAPIFRFLWQTYRRDGRAEAREAVCHLLDALCEGGIYDHLGGGFARYATDAQWHVPHFEKMLYDNAQILELLALAQADAPSPLYAARADETVGWLLREMRVNPDAQGAAAFAAAQDADQEGEEGLFYTWRADEIAAALGEDYTLFAAVYDVRPEGNWEGRNVLRRTAPHGDQISEARLALARKTLFALRETRSKPALDDKVLTDWNGLMIVALARAALVFERPVWLDAAISAYAFIETGLRDDSGRLAHAWRGRVSATGQLDDYASFILAGLALFQATGLRDYLVKSEDLAEQVLVLFGSEDGGVYLTAIDAPDVPGARQRHARDNATPSGAGQLAQAFALLWGATGADIWHSRCTALMAAFSGAGSALAYSPGLLGAADLLARLKVVVVAGKPSPQADMLVNTALTAPDTAIMILRTRDGTDWPAGSPAHGCRDVDANAVAYLCRDRVCSLPTNDSVELRQKLDVSS